jgi:hypothetical protein
LILRSHLGMGLILWIALVIIPGIIFWLAYRR